MSVERDATRERFLAAISEKIPVDRVVEVHLFQPLKQGGMESGVGVIAVEESTAESRGPRAEDRLVVYTARYLLTQKGPERGKWEFTLNAEADAPLVTVDKVVQGVQRRTGDAEEPRRLTGDEFREALGQPPVGL
jgi:hypothetical protein